MNKYEKKKTNGREKVYNSLNFFPGKAWGYPGNNEDLLHRLFWKIITKKQIQVWIKGVTIIRHRMPRPFRSKNFIEIFTSKGMCSNCHEKEAVHIVITGLKMIS